MRSSKDQDKNPYQVIVLSDFDGTLSDTEGNITVHSNAYKEATNIPSVVNAKRMKADQIENKLLPKKITNLSKKIDALIQQVELLVQHYKKEWNQPKQDADDVLLELERALAVEKILRLHVNAIKDLDNAKKLIAAAKNETASAQSRKRAVLKAHDYASTARDTVSEINKHIESTNIFTEEEQKTFMNDASTLLEECRSKNGDANITISDIHKLQSELDHATSDDTYNYLSSTEETVDQDREHIRKNIEDIMSREDKPDGWENFILKESAVKFIKQAIANENTKFVIVSKNHRAYIEAVLMYNGFDADQLKKISVKDCLNGGGNKEHCAISVVSEAGITNPNSVTVLILDDSKSEALRMMNGVSYQMPRATVKQYQYSPGAFPFDSITGHLADRQRGVDSRSGLEQSVAVDNNLEGRGAGLGATRGARSTLFAAQRGDTSSRPPRSSLTTARRDGARNSSLTSARRGEDDDSLTTSRREEADNSLTTSTRPDSNRPRRK